MAKALAILGVKRAMVVSGLDGYDEISLCAPTQITELHNGDIKTYIFNPIEVGLDFVHHSLLQGGDSQENLQITLDIFNAKPSPKLDLVALNMELHSTFATKHKVFKMAFLGQKKLSKAKKFFETLESFKTLSHQHLQGL